ncbi:MAG: hypothetical protein FJX23_01860 [Alphaproteobacteria bacterium]|nr:hypothetical protein [Alphaproteobacteria bacterium]
MSQKQPISEQEQLFRNALGAIITHDREGLAEVLGERIDPDYRPATAHPWDSLLAKAIFAENADAIDMLLAAGAGKKNQQDQTIALSAALDGDNEQMVHLLMEAGFNTGNLSPEDNQHHLMEEYRNLPNISISHEPENLKTRLFKKGANGKAPFDNPKVWHKFDEIAAVLEQQGTPIAKDDLFDLSSNGETWLDVAIKSHAFDAVQEHLSKQGEAFTLAEIRQEEGLMDLLCRKGNAHSLFNYDMLAPEGGLKGLRKLQEEVPQDSLWQVQNISQLRQQLRPLEEHRQGIGR